MESSEKKDAIFISAIYLFLQEKLHISGNFRAFYEEYILENKIKEKDFMPKYFISNSRDWHKKMDNYIEIIGNEKISEIVIIILEFLGEIEKANKQQA